MKSNFKKIILILLAILGCYSLHAQRKRRTCDVDPLIRLSKDTFQSGEQISFELLVHNNGPDKMISGDGFFYDLYVVINGKKESLRQSIIEGEGNDSIPFDEMFSYSNYFDINTAGITKPVIFDFCLKIFSEGMMNGEEVVLGYADPNKNNNLICVKVIIVPNGATTIEDTEVGGIEFLLYPNPARDKLYIKAAQSRSHDGTQIIIRDMTGRTMSTQTYKSNQIDQGSVILDLEQFPAGLYTITLQTGKEITTKKFSITR